jgi:hypothetical protein
MNCNRWWIWRSSRRVDTTRVTLPDSVLSVSREGELGELTRASAVERKHGCYESLNLKIMSYFECLKMVSTKDERCVLASDSTWSCNVRDIFLQVSTGVNRSMKILYENLHTRIFEERKNLWFLHVHSGIFVFDIFWIFVFSLMGDVRIFSITSRSCGSQALDLWVTTVCCQLTSAIGYLVNHDLLAR